MSESGSDRFGGRGYPDDYEPGEDELSEFKMALNQLVKEAEVAAIGTEDRQPTLEKDCLSIAFEHPDHDGGFMIPIRFDDLQVVRAARQSGGAHRGGWIAVEDVGVFDELPEWVSHDPELPSCARCGDPVAESEAAPGPAGHVVHEGCSRDD